MEIISTACTHQGRRARNEDSHLISPAMRLFAVADGMGGHAGGDVASRLVVDTVEWFFRSHHSGEQITWPWPIDHDMTLSENMVRAAVRVAHRKVVSARQGAVAQMGSTLAMVVLDPRGRAVIGHVGDSRVYRLRDNRLDLLTEDHNVHERLVREGTPNLPPRHLSPYGSMLTRALGFDQGEWPDGLHGVPDVTTCDVQPGDTWLLCSDGLLDGFSELQIAATLAHETPEQAAASLVSRAYDAGSRDNITAVVVRVDTLH